MPAHPTNIEISIILPCRNEEESLAICLLNIKEILREQKLTAEIIVSDSSDDQSATIARQHNVLLIKHNQRGYGRAYLEGFKIATGKFLFLADPDGTYDFKEIPQFIDALQSGNDFVIGNRFAGEIAKGAMPWHHQYIGNPLFSFLVRFLFKTEIHDVHCGMRAIRKEAIDKLNLKTTGMEFASEMVIKAIQNGLKIKELPIDYHKRYGQSKLRSFIDGFRHLKLIMTNLVFKEE